MPFETRGSAAPRVAVVGGGISGMGAAYELARDHHVVLFEAAPRLGGHARTVIAGKRGDQPVDTGFIVFNRVNYPNLVRLFEALDVPVAESDMSFGVSVMGGRVEYALHSIDAIFAQRRNLLRPMFGAMIRDILKFNREAEGALTAGATIRELCDALRVGEWFRHYYLTPLSGAIWSTPKQQIMDFPAEAMVRFFRNHGLLGYHDQHQWYTVKGGSVEYVRRLETALETRGVDVRLGAETRSVRRTAFGVEVRCAGGEWEPFDQVVFATHSDDTLRLLSDANGVERSALSSVHYQPNRAVLHADPQVMPKRKKVWASWAHVDSGRAEDGPIELSYWMNSLQPIPKDDPMFVTLNSEAPIREELIYDEAEFRHPVYDTAALAAQETVRAINGANRTWFCGAWMRNGFHEDGLTSGLEVAEAMRAERAMALAAE